MKRLGILLILIILLQRVSLAEVTKLPPAERKVLEDASRFHPIPSTAELPRAVVALCADDEGRLAETGKPWQPTDVIVNSALPRKRLIWAATDGKHYIVHYERGGIAHSFHFLVATVAPGDQKPVVIWRAVGGPLKDYAAFLAALKSGKLDDRLEYAH